MAKYLASICFCLLLSCATNNAPKQEIHLSPYLTEKSWRVMDYPTWKEFHFLVIHNPTVKAISTVVDCDTLIAAIVVPPNSESVILLNDGDLGTCITR